MVESTSSFVRFEIPTYYIEEMKKALATALNGTGLRGVPAELNRQAEVYNEQSKMANAEFQRLAEEAKVAKYNSLPSDVGKVVYDDGLFFRELGGVKQLDDLQDYEELKCHEITEHMGLFCEIAGDRRHSTLIIGNNRDEVMQAASERLRQIQPHQHTYDLELPPPEPLSYGDGCFYDNG